MPSSAPGLEGQPAAQLQALGRRLRDHRKQLRVSATTAAEAAGMSRATWHRIERGEPSVTMGAYLGAMTTLGLALAVAEPVVGRNAALAEALPASVRLADFPALQRLAWHLPGVAAVTPAEALALYERNWRHVDAGTMPPHEQALVQTLVRDLGGGRLLV